MIRALRIFHTELNNFPDADERLIDGFTVSVAAFELGTGYDEDPILIRLDNDGNMDRLHIHIIGIHALILFCKQDALVSGPESPNVYSIGGHFGGISGNTLKLPVTKELSPLVENSTISYPRCAFMLVKFEIYSDGKYWCGRGIGVDIFTQGKTLDELMVNIREAVELHFEEELGKGESIRILSISETEVGTVARASGC